MKMTKVEKLLDFLNVKNRELFDLVDIENDETVYSCFFDEGKLMSRSRHSDRWDAYDSGAWEYLLLDDQIEIRR